MDKLYRLCHTYLDKEQAHLESTRAVLRQVYEAAVGCKPQGLADLLDRQKQIAEATAAMHGERTAFRAAAGEFLDVAPGTLTVRAIAHCLPTDMSRAILARREEVHRLASAVADHSRDITLFCRYFLDFLRRFFMQLTASGSSGRYGPAGLPQEPVCGAILQARG